MPLRPLALSLETYLEVFYGRRGRGGGGVADLHLTQVEGGIVGLVINLVSRLEGADASSRWWLLSGRGSVLIVFGVFAALSLWLYWSGIGQVLGHEEDDDLPHD